jgi:hypothetical protein
MKHDLGQDCVYVMFDDTRRPSEGVRYGNKVYSPCTLLVNDEECKSINKLYERPSHETETRFIAAYQMIQQEYDYLWFIEYDVRCYGSYKEALGKCDHMDHDFLSNELQSVFEVPYWHYWDTWKTEIPKEHLWRCFFPVNRFTKRALAILCQETGKIQAFCETYTPTILSMHGMKMASFPTDMNGIMRWEEIPHNIYEHMPKERNKLYHPIKVRSQTPWYTN